MLLPGEEIRNAELGFAFAAVAAAREENHLVLSFADGTQIIFVNYFQIHDGNFPQLNFADGLRHLGPDDIRTEPGAPRRQGRWLAPGSGAISSDARCAELLSAKLRCPCLRTRQRAAGPGGNQLQALGGTGGSGRQAASGAAGSGLEPWLE